MRRYIALLIVPALLLIAVAGSSAAKSKPKALQLRSTSLGRILVDSKKRTLYMLTADGKNASTCSGACASFWPPAKAPKNAKVGAGLKTSKLKVIRRSDGSRQLAYAGHPLYRYSGDQKAGDVNGEGINAFGGFWYALSKAGTPVMTAPAATPNPAPNPYGY